MQKLDPTKMKDWEIAEAAEKDMKTVHQQAEELGLEKMELLPYGHYVAKLDYMSILNRLKNRKDGKYIEVTAITPTPLGEGKTTTSMGLVEGLGKLGKKVMGAIRQPSGGPTFNIKGSAAGGGLAQCIPLTDFSLGLTGDIDAVTNAHNLAMVAVTSRLQHEFNYDDEELKKKNLKRLDIDPRNPAMNWCMDFCAQALREIIIGMGGKMDGFMMKSGFQITVSSELMAILAVTKDLADMRERLGRVVVAYDKSGKPLTANDLEVGGAMTALMVKAINPNLMQTVEGQPVLVHAGSFRQHRRGAVLDHRRPDRPEAGRLPRHGERLRRGHRLREVLEHQVPLQRPDPPRLGHRLHGARPEDARRRAQGGARAAAEQGLHREGHRPGGQRGGEPAGPHRDREARAASPRWSASTTSTRTPRKRWTSSARRPRPRGPGWR